MSGHVVELRRRKSSYFYQSSWQAVRWLMQIWGGLWRVTASTGQRRVGITCLILLRSCWMRSGWPPLHSGGVLPLIDKPGHQRGLHKRLLSFCLDSMSFMAMLIMQCHMQTYNTRHYRWSVWHILKWYLASHFQLNIKRVTITVRL